MVNAGLVLDRERQGEAGRDQVFAGVGVNSRVVPCLAAPRVAVSPPGSPYEEYPLEQCSSEICYVPRGDFIHCKIALP